MVDHHLTAPVLFGGQNSIHKTLPDYLIWLHKQRGAILDEIEEKHLAVTQKIADLTTYMDEKVAAEMREKH